MIFDEGKRYKDGQVYNQGTRVSTVAKFLENIILFEFGYGAVVTGVNEDGITIETNVCQTIDKINFTSNVIDEINFIIMIAFLSLEFDKQFYTESPLRETLSEKIGNTLLKLTNGLPALMEMASGFATGFHKTKFIMLALFTKEINPMENDKIFYHLSNFAVKDLVAIYTMVYLEDTCTIEEAVELNLINVKGNNDEVIKFNINKITAKDIRYNDRFMKFLNDNPQLKIIINLIIDFRDGRKKADSSFKFSFIEEVKLIKGYGSNTIGPKRWDLIKDVITV